MTGDDILREQITYYRRRAAEYDATAYGDVVQAAARIDAIVTALPLTGARVLELACGTGMWTRALAGHAASVLAVDAAPQAIAVARRRCPAGVGFVVADVFSWRPRLRPDVVFFGFWLSHVPSARLAPFLAHVAAMLAPGARVAFVDQHADQARFDAAPGERDPEVIERALRDGTRHRLVKVYDDVDTLGARFAACGWTTAVHRDGADWIVGTARPAGG